MDRDTYGEVVQLVRLAELPDALTKAVARAVSDTRPTLPHYSDLLHMTAEKRRDELARALRSVAADLNAVAAKLIMDS